MTSESAIATLQLVPPFALDDVKRAFRETALQVHPDHGGSDVAMRGAIEARDALLEALARNPLAFSRPKPTPKPLKWHRTKNGNWAAQIHDGAWLTVFGTTYGTFKWVCHAKFSQAEWKTEEAAVEDAVARWVK